MPNRVKELRMKALMSQKDLAEKANVAQPVVCRVEKGHTPTLTIAIRLARALNVGVDDLFLTNVSTKTLPDEIAV